MNVILYSLLCYGITAVIAFLVVGVIVVLNKLLNRFSSAGGKDGEV